MVNTQGQLLTTTPNPISGLNFFDTKLPKRYPPKSYVIIQKKKKYFHKLIYFTYSQKLVTLQKRKIWITKKSYVIQFPSCNVLQRNCPSLLLSHCLPQDLHQLSPISWIGYITYYVRIYNHRFTVYMASCDCPH